jgi:hypothetical protein
LEKMLKDGTAYKAWKEIDTAFHNLEEEAGTRITDLELQLKNVNAACTDYRQKWTLEKSRSGATERPECYGIGWCRRDNCPYMTACHKLCDAVEARFKQRIAELEKALAAAVHQYAGEAAEYYEKRIAELEAELAKEHHRVEDLEELLVSSSDGEGIDVDAGIADEIGKHLHQPTETLEGKVEWKTTHRLMFRDRLPDGAHLIVPFVERAEADREIAALQAKLAAAEKGSDHWEKLAMDRKTRIAALEDEASLLSEDNVGLSAKLAAAEKIAGDKFLNYDSISDELFAVKKRIGELEAELLKATNSWNWYKGRVQTLEAMLATEMKRSAAELKRSAYWQMQFEYLGERVGPYERRLPELEAHIRKICPFGPCDTKCDRDGKIISPPCPLKLSGDGKEIDVDAGIADEIGKDVHLAPETPRGPINRALDMGQPHVHEPPQPDPHTPVNPPPTAPMGGASSKDGERRTLHTHQGHPTGVPCPICFGIERAEGWKPSRGWKTCEGCTEVDDPDCLDEPCGRFRVEAERRIAEAEANYSGMRASWQAALNRALRAEEGLAAERTARENAEKEMRLDWGRREDIWEGRLAMEKAKSKTFFEEGIKRADKIAKLEAALNKLTNPPTQELAVPKSGYPKADENAWPPNAKKSTHTTEYYNGVLGKIVSDGERGYICTHCGKVITKAHHIKPEAYAVIYEGERFYMERHICDDCMKSHAGAKEGGDGGARMPSGAGIGATPEPMTATSVPAPANPACDSKSPEERNIDAHAEELETMEFLIRQYANEDESKMLAGAIAYKNHIIGILNRLGWSRVPIPKGHLFEIKCPNCGGFWHDPTNNVGREELCRKCKLSPDVFAEFTAAMREKFNRSLTKGDNRSPTPWTAFSTDWLRGRLEDEWVEWKESGEGDPEELVDLANFSLFIWKRMRNDRARGG